VLPKLHFFRVQQWHLCLITPNSVQKLVPLSHIFIYFSKEVFESLYIILLPFVNFTSLFDNGQSFWNPVAISDKLLFVSKSLLILLSSLFLLFVPLHSPT
jgi:hypothetical protein